MANNQTAITVSKTDVANNKRHVLMMITHDQSHLPFNVKSIR